MQSYRSSYVLKLNSLHLSLDLLSLCSLLSLKNLQYLWGILNFLGKKTFKENMFEISFMEISYSLEDIWRNLDT